MLATRKMHSLPNNEILDWSKLKAFGDDNIKVSKKMIFVFDKVENIVEKGQNAGYQRFLFSLNVLKRLFTWGHLKLGLCGKEINRCIKPHLPEYGSSLNFLPNNKISDWFKLKNICRQQIDYSQKIKICFGEDTKHHGVREKMLFLTKYSKASMSECNNILSAYIMLGHLGLCCSHPLHCSPTLLIHSHTMTPSDTPGKQAF